MNQLQIKQEHLPIRCEICHQRDLFDPILGICKRCSQFINGNETRITKVNRFNNYLYPNNPFTGLLSGFIGGGFTGGLLIFAFCFFVFFVSYGLKLNNKFFEQVILATLYWSLYFGVIGGIFGFLYGILEYITKAIKCRKRA